MKIRSDLSIYRSNGIGKYVDDLVVGFSKPDGNLAKRNLVDP